MKKEKRGKHLFLLVCAFIAGFVIMSLEIVSFRIFAPYFGYSIYVYGLLIGIVMAALAVGYYLGGILADRKKNYKTIFFWIFLSTTYLFFSLAFYKIILSSLSSYFLLGVVVSSIIILGFPMAVLGMVSPYFTKLLAREQNIGRTTGKISSVGTIGAIVGTFIPTFFSIPYFGSFITFLSCGVLLLVIVLIYFCYFESKKKWVLFCFLFVGVIAFPSQIQDKNVILEDESIYNSVLVIRQPDNTYLLKLNDNKNIQSIYNPNNLFDENYYYYYLNAAPLMTDASSALVLGMGAGTSAYQMIKLFNVQVDAVEIDPKIVEIAQEYFGLNEVNSNLKIYIDDARPFLKKSDKTYDVIQIDAYQGGFYAPFYLLTKEFFAEVSHKLTPEGIVAITVLYPYQSSGDFLFKSVGDTISEVYPSVFYLNLNSFNAIIFASKQEVSLEEMKTRITENSLNEFRLGDLIAQNLKSYIPYENVPILSDDLAPVERLTYRTLTEIKG